MLCLEKWRATFSAGLKKKWSDRERDKHFFCYRLRMQPKATDFREFKEITCIQSVVALFALASQRNGTRRCHVTTGSLCNKGEVSLSRLLMSFLQNLVTKSECVCVAHARRGKILVNDELQIQAKMPPNWPNWTDVTSKAAEENDALRNNFVTRNCFFQTKKGIAYEGLSYKTVE